MRLDVFLTQQGLAESRKKASDMIKNGCVFYRDICVTKPAFILDNGAERTDIDIRGDVLKYVGRGGLKLEYALGHFGIDPRGMTAVDIGSSTGGFTDVLLQAGAGKVFAVDSGKDQLHSKLRRNCRVVVMESFNARHLTGKDLGEECDIAVMDVSFISQTLLYDAVQRVLKPGGIFISLIKPQFEAGKEHLGKNGIVKDDKARLNVCEKIKNEAEKHGMYCRGITPSPIKGGDGNTEYLACFVYGKNITIIS